MPTHFLCIYLAKSFGLIKKSFEIKLAVTKFRLFDFKLNANFKFTKFILKLNENKAQISR